MMDDPFIVAGLLEAMKALDPLPGEIALRNSSQKRLPSIAHDLGDQIRAMGECIDTYLDGGGYPPAYHAERIAELLRQNGGYAAEADFLEAYIKNFCQGDHPAEASFRETLNEARILRESASKTLTLDELKEQLANDPDARVRLILDVFNSEDINRRLGLQDTNVATIYKAGERSWSMTIVDGKVVMREVGKS